MRRMLRVAGLLVGLLLTVTGVAGAALVGPDDVYVLDPVSAGSQPGQVVSTHPELLSWRQVDVVVRAEAPGGTVLAVGRADEVADYLARVGHRLVTDVGRDGLAGRSVGGAAPTVPVHRGGDWLDVTSGAGTQELIVPLHGRSVRLLAAPLAADATVSLAFGVHVAGIFTLLVVSALVGALLAALAVRALWIRRGGRLDRQRGGPFPAVPTQRRPATAGSLPTRRAQSLVRGAR